MPSINSVGQGILARVFFWGILAHHPLKKLGHFLKFSKRPKKAPVLYFSIIKRFWLRMIRASHTNLPKNKNKKRQKKSLRAFCFSPANFWITLVIQMRSFPIFVQSLGSLQGCLYQILSIELLLLFFLGNFFRKMASEKDRGYTRAFFRPKILFEIHLFYDWATCMEPWTN